MKTKEEIQTKLDSIKKYMSAFESIIDRLNDDLEFFSEHKDHLSFEESQLELDLAKMEESELDDVTEMEDLIDNLHEIALKESGVEEKPKSRFANTIRENDDRSLNDIKYEKIAGTNSSMLNSSFQYEIEEALSEEHDDFNDRSQTGN